MNTYHRSDFEPNRWNGPFVFLIGCCLLVAIASGSFYLGMRTQETLHAEAKRIEDAKPKRAANLVNPPASLIQCDKAGREEFSRICRQRYRAGSVQ